MPPLSVRTRTSATQATRAALLHLVLPPPALKGLTWSLKGRVACERSRPALPHPLGQWKARRASHRYSESDSTAPRQQSFRSAGKPAARLSLQDNSTLSAWDRYWGVGRGAAVQTRCRGQCCCERLWREGSLSGLACPALSVPCGAWGCGRLCSSLPSASANICDCRLPHRQLSVLPPPFPPAAPAPLSPENVTKMGVQTAGRCLRHFLAWPGTGQPARSHRYLGSQICKPLDSSQVCPALS